MIETTLKHFHLNNSIHTYKRIKLKIPIDYLFTELHKYTHILEIYFKADNFLL